MTKTVFTHITIEGFGGILPAGIKCRILQERKGQVWIETINGTHFFGNAEDLEPVPIRETKLCRPKLTQSFSAVNEATLLVAKSWKLDTSKGLQVYETIANIINHSIRWN